MNVGLFIPCYVDQLYPEVAIATLELLEKQGLKVGYPLNQTCCGQPMANAGFESFSKSCNTLFIDNFSQFDYIVSPSGSCVLHVKEHVKELNSKHGDSPFKNKIFELTEFLVDILMVKELKSSFPYKVGIHQSCHGQRGLRLSSMSERLEEKFSKPETLLRMVSGIQLLELERKDECCGFGGTFCVTEEAVSVKMGKDRILDHERQGVDVITGGDMSCLMHLEGILTRQKSRIKIKHIAEILNGVKNV